MKHAGALILFCLLLAGCGAPLLNPGTTIEGEITVTDQYSLDSNDLMFYWDAYQLSGVAGATFEVEIETREGDPVHFEIPDLAIDVSCEMGTNTATFITPESRIYSCDVYLRSDFVGDGSSYRLTINRL
jgi:hypothetical protein